MAKKTLLQMVQKIMSDMDSDEVTSINDTVEATQVANTIQDVYEQLITNETIPEQRILRTPAADATNKVFVPIDTDVQEVLSVRYNDVNDVWSTPTYLNPEDFLDMSLRLDPTDTDVDEVAVPTLAMNIRVNNNRLPKYWTSFDDAYVVFDAYDSTQDVTGVQKEDVLMYVSYFPTFTLSDAFVIPVDENLFPYLLAEAKATCFVNLKQQANPKIEAQARRQKVKLQHGRYRTAQAEEASFTASQPNFGRGTTR